MNTLAHDLFIYLIKLQLTVRMCNKFSSGNIRKYTCINVPSDERKIYILDTCTPEWNSLCLLSGLIYQGNIISNLKEKSFSLQMFLLKLELNLDSRVDTHTCDRPWNQGSFFLSFLSYSLERSYIKAENWNLYLKKVPEYCANIYSVIHRG